MADGKWPMAAMLLCAASATAVVAAMGCGHRAEEAQLDRFFSASRLRDKTALNSLGTVTFEPLDQGIVRRFTIVKVAPVEENGGVSSKNVTLQAAVETPGGDVASKTLFVTMQRSASAPWMITGVTVSSADPSRSPR